MSFQLIAPIAAAFNLQSWPTGRVFYELAYLATGSKIYIIERKREYHIQKHGIMAKDFF